MNTIIIGSGPAGIATMERIRELSPDMNIILISKDKNPYSLCALPYYLSGEIKKIYSYNKKYFDSLSVESIMDKKVIKINTYKEKNKKNVILENNDAIDYDKLVICTGSVPIIPRIEGIDNENVYLFNSLTDCEKIKKALKWVKRATVIGSGVTGVECAIALRKKNIGVTLVELKDRLLPNMLDFDMSSIVKKILNKNGVKVLLNKRVERILGGETLKINIKSNIITTDIAIITTGVRPDIDVVANTGIKTNNGIIVDTHMKTSVGNVYASGDVAEYFNSMTKRYTITPLWLNAVRQGRIAGENICGIHSKYIPLPNVNVVNVFDTLVMSYGVSEGEIMKGITSENEKIILKNGKISGVQSIGKYRGIMGLMNMDVENLKIFYFP